MFCSKIGRHWKVHANLFSYHELLVVGCTKLHLRLHIASTTEDAILQCLYCIAYHLKEPISCSFLKLKKKSNFLLSEA